MKTLKTFARIMFWIVVGAATIGGCVTLVTTAMFLFSMEKSGGGLRAKDDAFHEAALRGDYAEVKRFLNTGKDADAKGLNPREEGGGALNGALL